MVKDRGILRNLQPTVIIVAEVTRKKQQIINCNSHKHHKVERNNTARDISHNTRRKRKHINQTHKTIHTLGPLKTL